MTCKSSLCGRRLSFQLAEHAAIRCIHLSGLSLVATPRARSLCYARSGRQLFSDPDTSQPLHLSNPPTAAADGAKLQPARCVYIQQINTSMAGDMGSSLGPKLSNCHFHHTRSEKQKKTGQMVLWFLKALAHHGRQ